MPDFCDINALPFSIHKTLNQPLHFAYFKIAYSPTNLSEPRFNLVVADAAKAFKRRRVVFPRFAASLVNPVVGFQSDSGTATFALPFSSLFDGE